MTAGGVSVEPLEDRPPGGACRQRLSGGEARHLANSLPTRRAPPPVPTTTTTVPARPPFGRGDAGLTVAVTLPTDTSRTGASPGLCAALVIYVM